MADANDVEIELLNNNDLSVLYAGSDFARRSGSLRDWLKTLAWDLLRFQPINLFRGQLAPDARFGLRDGVTRILYKTEENNRILRRLAAVANIDLTGLIDQ